MVQRHVEIGLARLSCFEVDRQVAVHQRRMAGDVLDIAAGHRVDGIDTEFWFVQKSALGPVARQRVGPDPVRELEPYGGCCTGKRLS